MTLRLSREEVIAKYSPTPDPKWTPEIEAEFFAGLPKLSYRGGMTPDTEKGMLIREFAKESLDAKRMSAGYVSTLGAILGQFAGADDDRTECLIAQRDEHLGTPDTIRTIQAQMLNAGYLVRETRSQGHGFVGDVFIYSPRPRYRPRKATHEILEKSYRDREGDCFYLSVQLPANLSPEDVPF